MLSPFSQYFSFLKLWLFYWFSFIMIIWLLCASTSESTWRQQKCFLSASFFHYYELYLWEAFGLTITASIWRHILLHSLNLIQDPFHQYFYSTHVDKFPNWDRKKRNDFSLYKFQFLKPLTIDDEHLVIGKTRSTSATITPQLSK